MTNYDYRSVTLRNQDVQDLNKIARREFGTDDGISVRIVIRKLIEEFDTDD